MKLNCVLRDGLGASLNGGSPRITPVPFTNNPSQSRNGANPGTMINNQQQQQQQPETKLKLPYNVKLSKVTGTSEAEKKLELLTRQLEKEMDEKEKQEYFGESHFKYVIVEQFILQNIYSAIYDIYMSKINWSGKRPEDNGFNSKKSRQLAMLFSRQILRAPRIFFLISF